MFGAKFIVQGICYLLPTIFFFQSQSLPDPCLLTYPVESAIFYFDTSRYELIYPGDALYNEAYDRSGAVLWDKENNRIAFEVYQAPGLQGFVPSYTGESQFYYLGNQLTLVVDGFSPVPRQLNHVYVRFLPTPPNATPNIYIDGEKLDGLTHFIRRLVVSSTIENGYFSDTVSFSVVWSGADALEVTVFSDKNGDRAFNGEKCYDVLVTTQAISAKDATWGRVKSLYQ